MKTIVLIWYLIATVDRGGPTVIAKITNENECRATAAAIFGASQNRGGPYIYAICVPIRADMVTP